MFLNTSKILHSVKLANLGYSKLTDNVLQLPGYSGYSVKHFLNNICSYPDTNYLEIGTWKGSTFVSAMYRNCLKNSSVIDNWSQFGNVRDLFLLHSKEYVHLAYNLFEFDCFEFDLSLLDYKVNVYFYDGDHTLEAQYKAFTYFDSVFADEFIAIVDDFNWKEVEDGTYQAFKDLGYTVDCDIVIKTKIEGDKLGWWNGLGIFSLKKN